MRIVTYYQSTQSETIKAASSWEALQMAQAQPENPALRKWVEITEIEDDVE